MGKSQRTTLIIGVSLLLVTLAATSFYFASRKEYSVLFADLQERDAAAVLEALEKQKMDYQIGANGTEILVPTQQVHRTRLSLMGEDISIHGGVGFEIFNDSNFGTTEFAQKVNFQRALQGELTRTIMSLKEVKYARIHLVMPESGLFKREGQQASGSVTLFLHEGLTLDAKQVRGIQRLISASVPKLEAHQVTVVDQHGNVLSAPPVSEEIDFVQSELDQKRSLEHYLKEKAEEVLAKTFGLAQFAVSIDATIDYNESTVTTEDIMPHDAKSKQGLLKSKELVSSANTENAPPKITREEEYAVGRSVSKTVHRPGSIKKISVGVLVPESADAAVVANVGRLVAMAVGVDQTRGDEIVVSAVLKPAPQTITAAQVSEPPPVVAPPTTLPDKILKPVEGNHLLVVAVLVLLLGVAIFRLATRQRTQDLTRQEREQLLLTLQNWVDAEDKRKNLAEY